jgi:tetratricopeptide (TPR) repeat protein
MKRAGYFISCVFMACLTNPAIGQRITPVYTGTLKCQSREKADSVKHDLSQMLGKICYVNTGTSLKTHYLPEDPELEITSDSISFNISKKDRYTFALSFQKEFIISEYFYLFKVYQMQLPDLIAYWKVKDLDYAKRFADDIVYLQNIRFLSDNPRSDFDSIAAEYRSLKVKPEIPEEARKYIVQANAMTQAKNYKQAIEYYNDAIRVNPAIPMIYNNQALLYAMIGRYNEAINCMKKYLKLSPDADDARAMQDKIYEYEAMTGK